MRVLKRHGVGDGRVLPRVGFLWSKLTTEVCSKSLVRASWQYNYGQGFHFSALEFLPGPSLNLGLTYGRLHGALA